MEHHNNADHTHITQAEIDVIVRKSVRETLTMMGIEAANPIEMQKDFQTLREWRNASASIRSKGMLTLIGILTAGILGALWIGVKSVIAKS